MSFSEAMPPENPNRHQRSFDWIKRAPEDEITILFSYITEDYQFDDPEIAKSEIPTERRIHKLGNMALYYLLKGLQSLPHLH